MGAPAEAAGEPVGGLRSLTTRLIASIAGAGALILIGILYKDSADTREILESEARRHSETAALGMVSRLRAVVRSVEVGVRGLGAVVAATDLEGPVLHQLIRQLVQDNPAVYGSTVAYAPGAFPIAPQGYAPYYHRADSALRYADLADAGYDFRSRPWFRDALESGRGTWSEPYLDTGGGEVEMVTFSLPVTRTTAGEERPVAVVTADISLAWLRDAYLAPRLARLGDGVEVVVLSPAGRFVSRRAAERMLTDDLADLASASPQVLDIGTRMMDGEEGSEDFVDLVLGERHWLHFSPVPETGWSVGVLFLESRMLALARDKHREDRLYALGGVLALVIVIVILARTITGPLRQLGARAAAIGTGRLDVDIPGSGAGDEVDALADAMREMQRNLAEHVERLAEESEARARIETELRAARDIQLAMLPRTPAASGVEAGCDLAASLISAREVGGDLYDFFALPDGRIAFAVGDVSGKGVPAALFMARSLTLFELAVRDDPRPGAVLEALNGKLEHDNEACMFVTMLCGVFDPASATVRFASAGHNPPLIAGAQGARLQPIPGGTVLGIAAGTTYPETEIALGPGEILVVYTDGVTEASDSNDVLYGEDRLLQAAALAPRASRAMLDAILASVDAFAAGAPQADDITVLAICAAEPSAAWERLPGEVLEMPSTTEALTHAREWLETLCRAAAMPPELVEDAQLVCEEILANIVHHAHRGDASLPMQLRASATAAGVSLAFRDSGPAYNPLDAPEPALDVSPEAREIGGLGVHLVRRLASRIDHAREGEHNVLVVCIARTADEPPGDGE